MPERKKKSELKDKKLLHDAGEKDLRDQRTIRKAQAYARGYMRFLDSSKTEREAVKSAIEALGPTAVQYESGKIYSPGTIAYIDNRGKSLLAVRFGTEPLENGVRIAASHVDSPRLDLKPNPVYEDSGLGFFKTHYYGGIKKYQWTAIPLACHGVAVKKDGTKVEITIGEKEGEPCFCVTDILPHLARKIQGERKEAEVIKGEELNILSASFPSGDDEKDAVKLTILKYLNDRYGLTEDDLISSELEFVPAGKSRFLGLDSSMVGGYGQDDRVCAYAALRAFLDAKDPSVTSILVLADKEEIGSYGATGLDSTMLQDFVGDLARTAGTYGDIVLHNSKCFSSDVSAALDPTFSGAYELSNSAKVNYGPSVERYTGGRGKSGSSEATSEYTAWTRNIFSKAGVHMQADDMGKVDEGGGGTVALYIARLGVDVIDVGVPVLSMHSPFEVTGILDGYGLYRVVKGLFEAE
ncbi:MAG: aminopeptidase [Oscillospiraceae bacterium]